MEGLTELVPWEVVSSGGLSALAVFIGFAIIRGWLIPARSVQQLLDIYRDRIDTEKTRGDEWRNAALAAQAATHDLSDQVVALTELTQNTHDLLRQIQNTGSRT